jgi:DNA-binding beta-propeller fold protein YncE
VKIAFALALPASVLLGARALGHAAVPLLLVTAVVGGLTFFSLRTMVMAVYERGDVPKDLLIYTQSSPEIPRIATDIDRLAAATGKGYDMPIAVDSADSMAWPWAWYLRDYRNVRYQDFDAGVPEGDWDVMLVNEGNAQAFTDYIASQPSPKFGTPEKYPHRWWYDERYKFALDTGPFEAWVTIGHGLHLGPPNTDTLKTLKDGVFSDGWLTTWYRYWRDHDAVGVGPWPKCTGCGAINAFAYFPANFDRETGMISVEPIQPPEPTADGAGRPVFGGVGVQPGQFFAPVDIETDAAGNLYVIDKATRKLQKFDSQGNYIASIDVRADPDGDLPDSEPWGIGIAPDGRVVVADTFGWRVRIFDAGLTAAILTFGQPPSQDPPGDYDLFGPRDAVVTSSGEVWVTDTGHDRVMVYSLDGTYIRTVGGSGSGPGEFDEPVGLALDAAGDVYVADMYNSRVEVFDASGRYLREFRVEGWGGSDVNDKPYLKVLSDGRVAVSLPLLNQVAIYSADGTLAGTIFDADDPVNRPYGMVETTDGKLWIVEGGNGRVRLFDIP